MTKKRTVLLAWALSIFAVLPMKLHAEETRALQKPEFEYSITVQAESVFARVYVNGAPLISHFRTDKMIFTYPITRYLRDGENRIVVNYEPFDAADQTYSPHDGVALQIEMRQRRGAAQFAEVDLLSARFDEKAGSLASSPLRVFGKTPVIIDGGTIKGPDRFDVQPVAFDYGMETSGPNSQQVSLSFEVNDATLKTLPWDSAPRLEDTPSMRAAMRAGYQVLHSAAARRDTDAYFMINDPLLKRVAYTLGYDDTSSLAERIWQLSPLGGPADSVIAPLPSEEVFRTARLRWSADKRMVGLQQDPVAFFDETGAKLGAYRVMFCQQPDKTMKVCHQMDISY